MQAKYKAVIKEVSEYYTKGQPVLIGTISVEVSELLSSLKGDSKVDGELSNRISNLRRKISEINNIAND